MASYASAAMLAGRLGDKSHRAAIRTSHAMVVLHGTNDLETARKIARGATIDAHAGESRAVRARAHAVHAEICARWGHHADARAALDRAAKTAAEVAADDPHGTFKAGHLSGFDGLCALHTGEASRANDHLDRSLGMLGEPREAVRLVRQALRPWRTEAFLINLDDHINDALIGR